MMSLKLLLSLIIFQILLIITNGQVFTGSGHMVGDTALSITIDYTLNKVVMQLHGPSNVWYGFGFGNTVMDGTYSIIMEYDNNDLSNGLAREFTLGNHISGNIYNEQNTQITILSDMTYGQTRTVTITRPIYGIYTFPNPPTSSYIPFTIPIISATGLIPSNFETARNAAHLSTNMASMSITLYYVTTTTTTSIPTPTPIVPITSSTTLTPTESCHISKGSVDTGNLYITSIINCMENIVQFDIQYKEYNNNWFGLVFNTEMLGDAIIFTTGINNDRTASLYSYNINDKLLTNIIYDTNIQWIQLLTILDFFGNDGLTISYKMDLDKSIWNKNTNSIQFNEAIGSTLILRKHIMKSTNTFNINLIPQTTTTTKQPTISPITKYPTNRPTYTTTNRPTYRPTYRPSINPTPKPITSINPTNNPIINPSNSITCATNNNLVSTIYTTNDNELIVKAILNCIENKITMDITYNYFNNNWFGLIFNTAMYGKALIYTTGLRDNELPSLYSYDILSRKTSDIIYNENENWNEILTDINMNNNMIHIIYEQELTKTEWNQNTKQIIFKYAIGNTLRLQYHTFRSQQLYTMDLIEEKNSISISTSTTTSKPSSTSKITSSTSTTNKPIVTKPITNTETSSTTTTTKQPISTNTNSNSNSNSNTKPDVSNLECSFGDVLNGGVNIMDEMIVNITLNCIENKIFLDIIYFDFNYNWFGLVFNNYMFGNSLIYTNGKQSERERNIKLYSYDINGRDINDIVYNMNNNWIEIESNVDSNGIWIRYEQNLDKTQWDKNTNEIEFRYAIGDTIFLQYHIYKSPQTYNIYLSDNNNNNNNNNNVGIICNDESMCSETTITCIEEDICIINCESFQSCYLSEFKCMNGYDCYINCIGDESCKDSEILCGDYGNCYINGLGEHSLNNIQIGQLHSRINNILKIECNGKYSCYESKIAAGYSNNLEIMCNDEQSCDNIKLQCPMYGENNCKILSIKNTEEIISIGNRIDIWAINSWTSINNLSYLPIDTTIGMNCGNNLLNNCEMIINDNNKYEWNCDNKISDCYIDYNISVDIIRCNIDEPCYNKTISCDNNYETCRIICDGFGSCSQSNIICPNNNLKQCEIICDGINSCSDVLSIECGTSEYCNIECNGLNACSNINIECGINNNELIDMSNEYKCNINGIETESLINSNIKCFNNSNCIINCLSSNTCNDIIIYGKDSNLIDILCVDHSCNNMELYCPSSLLNNKNCIISGQGDIHNELIIYAENSWNDIELTNYDCILNNSNDINQTSKMYCGEELNEFCIIKMEPNTHNWNCMNEESICYLVNNSYSNVHNVTNVIINYNGNTQYTQNELVAMFIIGCIPIIIIFVLAVYCFCYKPNKANKIIYKSVSKKNNKDDNIITKKKKDTNDKKAIVTDYDNDSAIVEFHANVEQMAFNR